MRQSLLASVDVAAGFGYRHERFRGDDPNDDLLDMIAGYDYQQTIGEAAEISTRPTSTRP
jgi:hypothetical protein